MGALEIDKSAIQRIYAIGAHLGMKGSGSGHDDALHALVLGLTGKESIKTLTPAEGQLVEQELKRRMAAASPAASKRKKGRQYEELPGGPSAKQQRYAWYLMQQIEKFDPSPDGVALRYRMSGLVEKMFQITSFPEQPFRFLTARQCGDLIEALKKMAERAELAYLHSPECQREWEEAHNGRG